MLTVPLLLGILLRIRDHQALGLWIATLTAFWFTGYCAFNAASWWLKATPQRRLEARTPLLAYTGAAAALGLVTVGLGTPALLQWAPVFVLALVPALVLAARRRERATVGGFLTTAAASLMLVVVRFPDPRTSLSPDAADAPATWALAALTFAYFFGTVLYIKTNIRERASRAFFVASIAWHSAATALAWVLGHSVLPGHSGLAWTVVFALATLRAAAVPQLTQRWTPLRLGLLEIAFCVAILAIVALG